MNMVCTFVRFQDCRASCVYGKASVDSVERFYKRCLSTRGMYSLSCCIICCWWSHWNHAEMGFLAISCFWGFDCFGMCFQVLNELHQQFLAGMQVWSFCYIILSLWMKLFPLVVLWTAFVSCLQTIAVIPVLPHGVVQLGSFFAVSTFTNAHVTKFYVHGSNSLRIYV